MITVADLIAQLSKMPAEARVVIRGYEISIDDIIAPVELRIDLDANPPLSWWNGPHEVAQSDSSNPTLAVFLGSQRRLDPF